MAFTSAAVCKSLWQQLLESQASTMPWCDGLSFWLCYIRGWLSSINISIELQVLAQVAINTAKGYARWRLYTCIIWNDHRKPFHPATIQELATVKEPIDVVDHNSESNQ
jgi:hypothetical protein